jgi:predicted RNase H-like HicB family nuclease
LPAGYARTWAFRGSEAGDGAVEQRAEPDEPKLRTEARRLARCSTDIEKRYPIGEGERDGMRYRVVLQRSEEGVAASVPGLPGCWSQGETEAEAVENIRTAIQEYLAVVAEQTQGAEVREVEVAV